MEIKLTNARSLVRKRFLQIIMRAFIFLLCTTVFGFNAIDGYSQQKITVKEDMEISIDKVFKIVSKQTQYSFLYPEELFENSPKVQLKKGEITLKKLLENIFSGGKINFRLSDNNVIIIEESNLKPTTELKKQEVQISGTVTDDTGQPLPGASILEKGTTNGTTTDFDGNYKIDVKDSNSILVISFIGFTTQEIKVNNQQTINVQLQQDAAQLDEVVVVGYGTLSRSKVVGAVSSLKTEDIGQLPVNSLDAAIAGRVPGVQVVSSGTPGGASAINIRGIGTLTAGGSPLIVVDGYPLTEGSDLNAINPNDIETMDILKDAASTAIYGSRGANGVILITTKKAKSDKVSFDFSAYAGFQKVLNEPKFLDAYQFAQLVKEARDWGYVSADPINRSEDDDNSTRLSQGAVSRHLIPNNFDKYLAGTEGLTNNNWLDDLFRSGLIKSYNMAVSSKTGNTNWYVSGGYFNQEGLILGSDFERYSVKLNLETKFNDNIKFGINLSPSISKTNSIIEAWTDGPMQQALLSEPFFTPYNDEGNLNISQQIRLHNNGGTDGALAENPIALALRKKDEKNKFRLYGSTFLEIEFVEGLKFKTLFGGDIDYSLREEFRPSTIGRYRNDVVSVVPWAKEKTKVRKNIISENTLNYTKRFGKHNLNLLGGYSYQRETFESIYVNAPKLDSNDIQNVSGTSETTTSKDISEWVKISYFGRAQYDYDSKYLLSTSIRSDGSSRFGSNTKFGNFASASAGWIVSNEDFFPENSVVSKLKLRYSWGQSGNDQIGNYGSIATLKPLNGFIDGSLAPGQIPSASPNADLSWETSITSNFGVDLGLFDGKLNLIADYFIAKTEDMLLNVPVPLQSGFKNSLQNVGKMENKGLEIVLSTSNIDLGRVKWNSSVNFTTINNEVTALGPNQKQIITSTHRTRIGNSIGELYGYVVDGIYKTQDEIDASAQSGTSVRVGDWKIVDVSGDGRINDDDRKSLGSTLPDFTYGFNNSFIYKNFDLNVFVDGVQGVNLLSKTVRNASNGQGFSNQLVSYFENRWHPTNNPNGTLARPDYTQSSERGRANVSSAFVEDGSFFRVRNITLGYNFPERVVSKIGLTKLRIYTTAKNPVLITGFKGFNPEQRNNNPLAPSNTEGTYPLNKSFVLGVNISF